MLQTSQGPLIARDRPRKMHEVVCPINLNSMRAAVINPKNGRVEQEFRARSLVHNFIRLWYGATQAVDVTLYNLAGSTNTAPADRGFRSMQVINSTAVNGQGILVGSDATAAAIGNNDLNTRLTADLSYSNVSFPATPTITAEHKYLEFLRTVTNTTDPGADITLREIGISGLNGGQVNLQAHDVLDSAVVLGAGEARIFRYRLYASSFWPSLIGQAYRGLKHTSNEYGIVDYTGVTRKIVYEGVSHLNMNAGIDVTLQGIRISSTETPTAWDAYTVADLYPTTTFFHTATTFGTLTIDAVTDTGYFTLGRDFINISGAAQTVREVGLFWRGRVVYNPYTYLGHASTLAAPIVVGLDEGIRITYRFSIET